MIVISHINGIIHLIDGINLKVDIKHHITGITYHIADIVLLIIIWNIMFTHDWVRKCVIHDILEL